MAHTPFSKKEAVSFGWKITKENLWFLVMVLTTVWVLQLVFGLLSEGVKSIALVALFIIAAQIIKIVVSIGLLRIVLAFVDKKKSEAKDLFLPMSFSLFFKYLFGQILVSVITGLGFLFFIIPGIIFAIKLQFVPYLLVEGKGPFEAILDSWNITKGHKWNLFLLGFLLAFINLIGVLALIVGLYLTIPTTMMAHASVYRKLQEQAK
tara:strand:- start:607 stop:1227 length:621 start_codon:yes stop_codon:yes gene_type:complete